MRRFIKSIYIISLFSVLVAFIACEKETEEIGTHAIFEFVVSDDNSGTVTFENISVNADSYSWDFGDGNTSTDSSPVYTYSNAGAFDVVLTAKSDKEVDTSTRKIIVAPNLVQGGNMSDESVWAFKQVWTDASNAVEHAFVDGTFRFDNADGAEYSQSYLWQEVALEAGKNYRFNANLKTGGTAGLWFEVYFGKVDPNTDGDYGDGKRFAIQDCLNDPVEGDINAIASGCTSTLAADGTFSLNADELSGNGTVYIVFKTGSWGSAENYKEGLYLDDISIIEVLD